ncbi:SMP-30/gluconolactonase/LRE family protein [Microbacterium sp. MAHUQ-60]|uniref:SMP-30/gluconolactonase/LRE family protein n=1 Tax=unclassified Microbacterium TaxID=2609290 RepID=UPI00360C7732
MRILAEGLSFPEGPVSMPDGSIVLVEVARGVLTRIDAQGRSHVVSDVGGGPNGAALAPDGRIVVCNNGGGEFASRGGPAAEAARIEIVDLERGESERLYEHCDGHALSAPNDLVFDGHGGFWFTDFGKRRGRTQDVGSVYWARADGTQIREVIRGLHCPNGIGLSPDGSVLYVAETLTARLWSWSLTGPGAVEHVRGTEHGGLLVIGTSTYRRFDSLAVSVSGKVLIGTLETGGITEVDPVRRRSRFHPLPDRRVTNVCFDASGADRVYVTLAQSGRLVELPWTESGHPLAGDGTV